MFFLFLFFFFSLFCFFFCLFCFFFQAEDGIRDLVRSRGLGDVYKRQAVEDEILDRIGDVRNHLDGGAEIVAAPFLGEDVLIDAPCGDVVGLGGGTTGEALVMAEIEISLGAVSYTHLTLPTSDLG